MIKSITVTNYLGDSITIELARPELSGFVVQAITGLGPGKATINTSEESTRDGGLYNSARLSKRNIVIGLKYFHWSDKTIEELRHLSYKYFPIKKNVKLLIETDDRKAEIEGYVENNDPDIFSKGEGADISIICPDPYFYSSGEDGIKTTIFSGVEPMFEFPFESELPMGLVVPTEPTQDFVTVFRYSANADGTGMTEQQTVNSKYVGIGYMPAEILENPNRLNKSTNPDFAPFTGKNINNQTFQAWVVDKKYMELNKRYHFAIKYRVDTTAENPANSQIRNQTGDDYTSSFSINSPVVSGEFTRTLSNIWTESSFPLLKNLYFRLDYVLPSTTVTPISAILSEAPDAVWKPSPSDWLSIPGNVTWIPIVNTSNILMGAIQNKTETIITYDGDSETGIIIKIHAVGTATNITIYNVGTRESMRLDTDKIEVITGSGIIAGDDIIICTIKGQKSVTLLRQGEEINILNCLDRDSDWPQLSKGDNIFAYTAETGASNLQFSVENRIIYEGV